MNRILVCFVVALAFGQNGSAQPPAPPQSVSATGTELFRGLLNYHGVKPLSLDEYRDANRADVILILMGRRSPLDFEPGYCSKTLLKGGSVLIAAEEPLALTDLGYLPPEFSQLQITGKRVCSPRADRCFNANSWCPFIVPQPENIAEQTIRKEERVPLDPARNLMDGLTRVATNVPSVIRVGPPTSEVEIGSFPRDCQLESVTGPLLPEQSKLVVASTGPANKPHRLLVIADTGVFSNQMMAGTSNSPTDNLAFANAVTLWLKTNDTRKKCLFIENGVVITNFDTVKFDNPTVPPITPPNIPDFDPLSPKFQETFTKVMNDTVGKLQDKDTFNRAILGNFPYDKWLRNAAFGLGVVFLVWLSRRIWNIRHQPDLVPIPKDTGRMASSGKPGSIARRREELLQTGNYTPIVREYLQDLFQAQGFDFNAITPLEQLPPVTITGPDAKTLTAQLRKLWDVAYGPKSRPIIYSRWKELEPMIQAVQHAARDGRWRFDSSRLPGGQTV